MSRNLTIRGVSEELVRRLESLSRSRGQSLNATVLEILKSAVGVSERRQRLARYTTWTEADLKEFNGALAAQRSLDGPSGAADQSQTFFSGWGDQELVRADVIKV